MKKIVLAIVLLMTTLLSFGKTNSNYTPTQAEVTFAKLYLDVANPKWTKVNNYDVATFYLNGYKMKAFFSGDGSLYSTVKILRNQKELTPKMLDNIHSRFPGFGMTELILESGKDNEPAYYAKITDGDTNKTIKIYMNAKIEEMQFD